MQLVLNICIFCTMKTLWSRVGYPLLAPVWLNIYSWTWFVVIIIFSVKFWWFSFFLSLYYLSRNRVTAVWRLVNICWNFSNNGWVWLPDASVFMDQKIQILKSIAKLNISYQVWSNERSTLQWAKLGGQAM